MESSSLASCLATKPAYKNWSRRFSKRHAVCQLYPRIPQFASRPVFEAPIVPVLHHEVQTALYTAFMTSTRKQSTWLYFFLGVPVAGAIMAALFVAPRAQGQEQPNASDVADGMRLYEQKGNCQSCHGWAGDGHKTDSQMPDGPNLRETKLNRAGLVLTIKCGRLNSQMPAFD